MNTEPEFCENERLQESVVPIDSDEQITQLLSESICMLPFAYGPGKQRLIYFFFTGGRMYFELFWKCDPCLDYCRSFE